MTSAYLLVTHGSRDPRPQIAAERLVEFVAQQLNNFDPKLKTEAQATTKGLRSKTAVIDQSLALVSTAPLELAPLSLHQSIEQFAGLARAKGCKKIEILPLFLLPGVHVKEDIPCEVALAQQILGADIELHLRPYLGSNANLKNLLAREFAELETQKGARILLAHGSRRPGSNQAIEAIAMHLNAVAAYWSVSPSLSGQVEAQVKAGYAEIAIVPYFLFAGGITEAIASEVQQLQQAFGGTKISLGEPLGATPQLAKLIVEQIEV